MASLTTTVNRAIRSRPATQAGLPLSPDMCSLSHMATNLAIDDRLLDEALRIGGHRTKKDTVNEALTEYIQHRRQAKMLDLFGTVEFDAAYDYKKQRRRP